MKKSTKVKFPKKDKMSLADKIVEGQKSKNSI